MTVMVTLPVPHVLDLYGHRVPVPGKPPAAGNQQILRTAITEATYVSQNGLFCFAHSHMSVLRGAKEDRGPERTSCLFSFGRTGSNGPVRGGIQVTKDRKQLFLVQYSTVP